MPMIDTGAHIACLFEAHEQHIRAYCSRRLDRSSVDDAVSETFAVAWRKSDQVPAGDDALPWLYGIAHRVVQHAWRSAGRRERLRHRVGSSIDRPRDEAGDTVDELDQRRRVVAAAARLRPADQEILRLTLWEELTPAQVALVLGISTDSARQRASRARRRLADEYRRAERAPVGYLAEKGTA